MKRREYKIAIIDDKEKVRKAFREVYGGIYPILEASSGEEGESLIKKEKEDLLLVILDLEMPWKHGGEIEKTGEKLAKLCNKFKINHLIVTNYFHGGDNTRLYYGYLSYKNGYYNDIKGSKENIKTWKELGELCYQNSYKGTIESVKRHLKKLGNIDLLRKAYDGFLFDSISETIFAMIYEKKYKK